MPRERKKGWTGIGEFDLKKAKDELEKSKKNVDNPVIVSKITDKDYLTVGKNKDIIKKPIIAGGIESELGSPNTRTMKGWRKNMNKPITETQITTTQITTDEANKKLGQAIFSAVVTDSGKSEEIRQKISEINNARSEAVDGVVTALNQAPANLLNVEKMSETRLKISEILSEKNESLKRAQHREADLKRIDAINEILDSMEAMNKDDQEDIRRSLTDCKDILLYIRPYGVDFIKGEISALQEILKKID